MSPTRTYSDACGVARALDLVGERWALMIVRELLLGPKRFTDIRNGLPHLSPDILTQRLRELEEGGVVRQATLPPPAASRVYELTPRGHALEPVLIALGRWGGANCEPPPEGVGMSLDSHLVSLRTLFDPELASGYEAWLDLRLDDQRFRAHVSDGQLTVERGDSPEPGAVIQTDPETFLALLHGRRELDQVLAAGDAEVDGDPRLLERFFRLFPLPAPA